MPELWFQHWLDLIAKYGRERFGREIPMDKLQQAEPYKVWGWYMDALAYYKIDDHYLSLDDVPDECKDGRTVKIRTKGRLSNYNWYDGEWKRFGYVEDKFYKG